MLSQMLTSRVRPVLGLAEGTMKTWRRKCRIAVWLLITLLFNGCFDGSFSQSQVPVGHENNASVEGNPVQIPEPYTIEITGTDYRWRVRYPGIDGLLATNDDVIRFRDVHIPTETNVELVLKSADFVYGLALPEFQKREIAVPNLEFRVCLRPTVSGTYALNGDEFCGDPHPELTGVLIVESRERFQQWLVQQSPENTGEVDAEPRP